MRGVRNTCCPADAGCSGRRADVNCLGTGFKTLGAWLLMRFSR